MKPGEVIFKCLYNLCNINCSLTKQIPEQGLGYRWVGFGSIFVLHNIPKLTKNNAHNREFVSDYCLFSLNVFIS